MPSRDLFNIVTAIAMLAVLALVIGAIALFRRGGDRKQPLLMLGAALVLFANILIWTWPHA
ncbi:putative membrane protein YhfC [Sphingomonas zeicaulis]|uniref:hypothetical protein n=1 Tax=Sphingomonas zeicaulis TaxID=1632740 RepID=UPI003D1FC3E0